MVHFLGWDWSFSPADGKRGYEKHRHSIRSRFLIFSWYSGDLCVRIGIISNDWGKLELSPSGVKGTLKGGMK